MDDQKSIAVNDPAQQLLKEMKRAKGSRFNASKRLERRDRRRTAAVAYSSASVILLTLLPLFFSTPPWLTNLLALATVAMSLVILAYSLLQGQANDPVKADQFHRCATEINELRRILRVRHSASVEDLEKFSRDYDGILRRYSINHDEEDYELYQLQHPDEFPQMSEKEWGQLKKLAKTELLLNRTISAILTITGALTTAAFLSGTDVLEKLRAFLTSTW